ncbi:MAG TPA: hypothetical protein VND65_13180 [Candidatus Binatia bacterium]|nr:hypothetical protein [Candidatus Binatia bacterium]
MQKSLQANQRDWEAEAQFDYLEQDCERDGKKTYEKTMMLGSPYQRLVEADGKALSALQQDEEKQKMQRAWTQRRNESPRARDRRIAKYESERRRDQMLMDEMVKAFDFNLQAEAKVDGHDVYVLQAKPRPGYQPPTLETKALTGMEGTLWIDKETFQWVKVEAKVVRPVAMGGILAKLEPGTHFELEKVPVAPGIWLPKHFAMASKAKILLFHNYENRQEENYFNFRRTGRDAHQASNRNPAATDASQ